MKTAEAKPTARQAARTEQPFFNKGGYSMLSSERVNERGYFLSAKQNPFFANNKPIQTKLSIGSPNDKYEREADHVADKVVQRLSKNEPTPSPINTGIQAKTVQPKPISPVPSITPMGQAKCASCEQEEKLQKKEEEKETEAMHGKLQKKPIFDSNTEPPPDEDKRIQRKCAECEKEEKLQKRESDKAAGIVNPQIQLKPIFESNNKAEEQVQRKCAECEKEEHVQKQESNSSAATATPSVGSSLSASKGSGSPLPESTRTQMESSIGADFSGVRIHNNSAAAQLSDNLNAQAFTHGNDIYFNSGKYDTSSSEGKHLLAHELTHTVQQGASIHRKEQATSHLIQKAGGPAASKPTSSEVVDISKGSFNPSEKVKGEIEEASHHGGLDVRIRSGAYASEGIIKIEKKGDNYNSSHPAYLALNNAWFQKIPALVLRVDIKNNAATGLVTIKGGGTDVSIWLKGIKQAEDQIGMGFHFSKKLPGNITNKLENGTLQLGFKDFSISIGGFLDMKLNFEMANITTPVFDGSATLTLKGAEGVVNVDNKQGKLGGSGSLTITGFKGFSGLLEVKYDAATGLVDIHGKAEYTGDKLTGSIELVSTDLVTANNFAKDAIKAAGGVENAQTAAPPAAVPAPKADGKRGIAGAGQLQFHLTEWFAGTVNVVVDAEGHITVIGKIAPPAEITLFKQKNWDNELFKLEAKAYYGIPVVGNLNLFANVSLHSIAKLGPAKIYNIEIIGTYSTDPTVQKNIQIAGSINISGYAGLRLRAEGGAGIEILSHDLKFGVGVQADVGVEAYADARPTIGWREPGEFFISGTLDLVAQPVLGLGGDFFIAIETPWWSPLSDHRWTWPLFAKQWPLTDPIGISAELKNYVLGSGNVPDITFKKPEFDASKFMTNMVDDTLPPKSGEGGKGQGAFKEDGSVKKPELPDPKKAKADKAQAGKDKPKKGATPPAKGAKPKTEAKSDPEAVKIFEAAGAKLKGAIKEPVTRADLQKKLTQIENSTKGIKFNIQQEGDKWKVTSTAKKINNPHPVSFTALLTEADKKGSGKDNIEAALQEIDKEGKEKIADGEVTKADADKIVADVKKDHPTVIQSISVMDGGATWDFEYVQKTSKKSIPKKHGSSDIKIGNYYKSKEGVFIKISSVAQDYTKATNVREGREMKFDTATLSKLITEKSWKLTTEAEISKITPDKRFFPSSWSPGSESIRPKLYESHGWATKSTNKKKAELPGIKAEIYKVMNSMEPAKDIQWQTLKTQGKVERDAGIHNYDPDAVEYQVDHEPDLAISWNGGDNNTKDDIRRDHVLNDSNLRVVTKQFNLAKSKTKYFLWVGKNFESEKLNVPKDAKAIGSNPFLATENGKPIL